MAKQTIIGNRQIDSALTNQFAQSLTNATQKLDTFAQTTSSYSRQSFTPAQYMMQQGMPGGTYSRQSFTPAQYQKNQQSFLAAQASFQGNATDAQVTGRFKGYNLQADKAREAAGKSELGQAGQFAQSAGMGDIGNKMQLAARAAAGDPTAIAELIKMKLEDVQKRISSAGQHAMGAATSKTASGAVSHGLEGTADIVGMSDDPWAKAAEGALRFGAAIIKTVDKIKEWGDSLHQANMQFAEFSGSMAAVQARSEVRDMQLSQRRGERRAESAEALAVAKNRFESAVAPIDDAWNNLQNQVATWMLDGLAPVIKKLGSWLGLKDEETGQNENTWMEQTFNEKWFETHGRPQRFKK